MKNLTRRAGAILAAASLTMLGLGPAPADATDVTLGSTVSENPANYTPAVRPSAAISNDAVYAIEVAGDTTYVGGRFDTVQPVGGAIVTRKSLFSFDATDGSLAGLSVTMDGDVWGIAPSGTSLYVGGTFTTVNGVARRGIVKINATTGVVDTSFNAGLKSGKVEQVRLVNGRLIIGGSFPGKLLALNPTTGANTGYINIPIIGTVASNAGPTDVYRFSVSPDGTRLVAVGNFTNVAGQPRMRAFMLNLGASATLSDWYYQPLDNACKASSLPAQLRDVDFAPTSDYFVIVATGYIPATTTGIGRDICDAAARFETKTLTPNRPTWLNYSGGDTFHSVAVSGHDVYVQGHFRYLDNPLGNNSCGPGCTPRSGIGALDPVTGHTNSWNPGKDRGVGGRDLTVSTHGLWVGSDTVHIGGESHQDLALMPAP